MKEITGIHFADLHHTDNNAEQTLPPLDFIVSEVRAKKPDFVVFAGDLGIKRGTMSSTESKNLRSRFLEMADVCKVFIIPGNHDIPNKFDMVDSVQGIFTWKKDDKMTTHPNIIISSSYGHKDVLFHNDTNIRFYFLPHPSKYIYLAQAQDTPPTELNKVMSNEINKLMLRIEADRKEYGGLSVLTGHGTIKGGIADSEQVMTTELDIAIDKDWLPNCEAIMYGHLHRHQEVGRAVYSGSPAPLTFAQELVDPKYLLWTINDIQKKYEPISIPIQHQLITIDILPKDLSDSESPTNTIKDIVAEKGVSGAKVRLRCTIPQSLRSLVDVAEIRRYMDDLNVYHQNIIIETDESIKIRIDDVDGDLSIENLLDVWAGLDENRKEFKDALIELHKSIITEVPADKIHELSGTDYKTSSLEAHNYKPLIDVKINFAELGNRVGIFGANHSGKSQVAEIERFANWKILRKGGLLKNIVRDGTKEAFVKHQFSVNAGKKLFEIKRIVKLDNRGNASSDVLFMEKVGDEWVPVNEGGSTETQKSIENYLGTYSMYKATRFGSQSEIDLLCKMLPSDLINVFQEALNVKIYDIWQKIAKKQVGLLNDKYDQIFYDIKTLEESIDSSDILSEQIEQAEKDKKDHELIIETNKIDLGKIQKQIADAQAIKQAIVTLDTQITNLNIDIVGYETSIKDSRNVLDNKDSINAGCDKLKQLRKKSTDLQNRSKALYEVISTFQLNLSPLNDQILDLNKAKIDCESRISGQETTINQKTIEHDNKLKNYDTEITVLKNSSELIDSVPCSNTEMSNECQLLSNARESKTKMERLISERKTYITAPKYDSELDKELNRLNINLKQITNDIGTVQNNIEKINGEKTKAIKDYDDPDQLRTDIEQTNTTIKHEEEFNWESLKEGLVLAEEKIRVKTEEMNKRISEKKRIQDEKNKLPTSLLSISISELQTSENSLSDNIKSMNNSRDITVQNIGRLIRKREEMEEKKIKIKELKKSVDSGVRDISLHNLYIQAVSRDGLPYLLLERAVPQFERYANDFLCADEGFESTLRVHIDTVKNTQTGDERNEVIIKFVDELGMFPLCEASGYQKIAIGYALRAAMAKINSEATGTIIHHCTYDEGWGAFDSANQLLGKRMIQKLGDEFEQFFYITHIATLQEVADSVINLVQVEGGSEINVVK